MGRLIQFALRHARFGPLGAQRRFCQRPVETQSRVLRTLLQTAANTEWGRRFEFGEIAREPNVVAAYQRRVPLHKYSAFRPDLLRVVHGERDIVWPGRPLYVSQSAGTTSTSSKVLPTSATHMRNNIRHAEAILLSYLRETGRTGSLRGFALSVIGRLRNSAEFPGLLIGDMSACCNHYAIHSGGPIRRRMIKANSLPAEILNRLDFEEKATGIADYAIPKDVRLINLMPSMDLSLLDRMISRYNETHDRQISTLGEMWPNLQLVVTGGCPQAPYRELMEQRIGLPDVDFIDAYAATEGGFAFQTTRDDPSMLVNLDNGVFFEFVRRDEYGSENPRRYTVADIEPDVAYALVISTCSGLWSYVVGDAVRFMCVNPPKLLVAGRLAEQISTMGERLEGEQVRQATQHACQQTGARVREMHLSPIAATRDLWHRVQWLIEFEGAPPPLETFVNLLDGYLISVNGDYKARRTEDTFGPPEVIPVPEGTFYRWRERTLGVDMDLSKVPLMRDDRSIAESILKDMAAQSPP